MDTSKSMISSQTSNEIVEYEEMEGMEKLLFLTQQVLEESRNDSKYIICFVGGALMRLVSVLFNTFMLLWITSYVDKGVIEEKESKDLY